MPSLRSPFSTTFGEADARYLSLIMRALNSPARLRIVHLLHVNGPMTSVQLRKHIPLAQPTISYHLSTLQAYGVVRGTKDGAFVDYELNLENLAAVGWAFTPKRGRS